MPLSPSAVCEAATRLAQRRRSGAQGPCLPPDCRPQDMADALAIQRAVVQVLGESVAAWKCGLPQPGRTVMAPIVASTLWRSASPGSVVRVWPRGEGLRIEPEWAFVLARDLPACAQPYTDTEVLGAVGAVHLALELIDTRHAPDAQATFTDQLADGLFNQGLVLGPAVPLGEVPRVGGLPIAVTADGTALGQWVGQHPDGDPCRPLCWLANALAAQGAGLRAGQVVITGSLAGAIAVPLHAEVRVAFGTLGAVQVRFAAVAPGPCPA